MPNVFGYYFSIKVEADPMLEKEDKELPDRVPILISDSEEDLLKRTPLNV
jgi:hypothetical protein